ncbi:MAG: glycosyltransferase [Chromatocurvus sp.]
MKTETNQPADATPLRVLHIGKYFPPFRGGMETYLRDLMHAMTRTQVTSDALVHDHEPHLRARVSRLDTPIGELTIVRAARWMNLSFAPISPGFPFLLTRMIKRQQPDILHFHLPNASAFWALLLPQARRLPWVVHWHSDVPDTLFSSKVWLRPLARLYRAMETAMLRRSARIIATSPPYLQSSDTLSTFQDKCTVIPLGIPPPHREVDDTDGDSPGAAANPRLKVLAVGRLSYYKGFDVLLEALSRVQCAQVQLVGSGERHDDLQRQAAALSLGDLVTFRGSLSDEDLETAWAWCDCLCLPSIERSEAFGVVLLEAMARGKPCLVADVKGSGMGWLVEHGVTGLTFRPGDAQALADTLQSASADPSGLERMGLAGQEKFREQLDIAISSRQVRQLYDQVLAHD